MRSFGEGEDAVCDKKIKNFAQTYSMILRNFMYIYVPKHLKNFEGIIILSLS